MQYSELGRTGLRVSRLGLGGANMGEQQAVSDRQAETLVHAALDRGITFIDTAASYGESERRIGLALKGRRNQAIVASKVGKGHGSDSYSYERTIQSVERSLQLLRMDHIDLMQIHSLENAGDERVRSETLPALKKLQEQGKIRFIGVSGRKARSIEPYVQDGTIDAIQPFGTYTLIDQSADEWLFPHTRHNRIGVVLASPLWMGILADQPAPFLDRNGELVTESQARMEKISFLRKSAGPGGLVEAAMRFCISCPDISVTLTGTTDVQELLHNADYCDGKGLDPEEQQRVLELFRHQPL
ncbi:aldo/keto reductase [Paenibacillus cymbidii]|uniref:aldo/keto reductase n=1 Tax=Paenibacillus cymbidii TaxID=1639034 RepID=UPI0010814046|nr:aldo/keto reductase [Paenibacillus cymbidii]